MSLLFFFLQSILSANHCSDPQVVFQLRLPVAEPSFFLFRFINQESRADIMDSKLLFTLIALWLIFNLVMQDEAEGFVFRRGIKGGRRRRRRSSVLGGWIAKTSKVCTTQFKRVLIGLLTWGIAGEETGHDIKIIL